MKNRFLLLLIVIIVISEKRMGVFIMHIIGGAFVMKVIVNISFLVFAKWRML